MRGARPLGARSSLLRAAEGATFRAAGLGIVKVQLLARRPLAEARREAVAVRALAACGAPLAAPLDDPVAIEDVVVGTWRDVPDEGRADPGTAAALGDALRVLHAVGGPALATGAVAVAAWAPLGWLDGRLARVRDHVDAALAEQLRAGAEAAFAVLAAAPVAVLHTDAHRGNARITRRGGAILVDTEGLAAGPAIYDLAAPVVLERRYGGDERRVLALLAAYGAAPDDPLLAAACRLREHLAVAWLAGRAEDEPALLDEARRRADDLAAGRDDATWTAR